MTRFKEFRSDVGIFPNFTDLWKASMFMVFENLEFIILIWQLLLHNHFRFQDHCLPLQYLRNFRIC